jgi:hypothetical protein
MLLVQVVSDMQSCHSSTASGAGGCLLEGGIVVGVSVAFPRGQFHTSPSWSSRGPCAQQMFFGPVFSILSLKSNIGSGLVSGGRPLSSAGPQIERSNDMSTAHKDSEKSMEVRLGEVGRKGSGARSFYLATL